MLRNIPDPALLRGVNMLRYGQSFYFYGVSIRQNVTDQICNNPF